VSRSSIPQSMRAAVSARDRDQCRYCGLAQFGHGAAFHVDHILPRSRGGTTELANLALQCPNCSLHKANRVDAVDGETGTRVPLFHPLRQTWREHFSLTEDGMIAARTAVGRATVAALRMNDPIPRVARACQLMLGLMTAEPK
jgi:hypothetical protein